MWIVCSADNSHKMSSFNSSETRGPRWSCIAHLNTRHILSHLAFQFRRSSSKYILKMTDVVAILDFRSILAIFYLQVTSIFLTKFPADKQHQNDVVSTLIRRDHVASTLLRRQFYVVCPLGFQSIGLLVHERKFKIDLQDGKTETILAIFIYKSSRYFLRSFRVNCPFCSGQEAQNTFSRWPLWPASWTSDRKKFSHFLSTSLRCCLPSFESVGIWFRRRSPKQNFKTLVMAAILDFRS